MLPRRHTVFQYHVACRTRLLTFPAVDTHIGIHRELLVGDHPCVEIGTNHVAERPGCQSSLCVYLARLPFLNQFDVAVEVLTRLADLLPFTLWRVGVHKRQADIRLGHDERKSAVQMQPLLPEVFIQHLHCPPDAVTASHECIDEGRWLKDDVRAFDELPDDMWWLPTMNGKAESQSLALLQLILTLALPHLLGDEEQLLTRLLSQPLCRPSGITCTREIENHVLI